MTDECPVTQRLDSLVWGQADDTAVGTAQRDIGHPAAMVPRKGVTHGADSLGSPFGAVFVLAVHSIEDRTRECIRLSGLL